MTYKTKITKKEYIENRVRGCCFGEIRKYVSPLTADIRREAAIDIDELMEFILEIVDEKKIPREI